MKKSIFLLALTFAFVNCKNKSEEINKTTEPIEIIGNQDSKALLEIGCYAYNNNKSSILFEVTDTNNGFIKGHLNYRLAEKDANMGTFEGVLLNDILLGDYMFQSEGVISKREVIFKIVNQQLIEGYGPMDENGICFMNTDHVTFSSTMPLSKTKCPK